MYSWRIDELIYSNREARYKGHIFIHQNWVYRQDTKHKFLIEDRIPFLLDSICTIYRES